ncbi:hypothetical protein TVAG_109420 [Trichomonas vaginalis G3]|uniref:Ubiquitin-like domain-containing protein n=1 Tax=Trichomonas vaginalis (strain ATCC PRA-98 / G3) TaxID=412133 RepID=A2EAD1_TRIV3|nr:hypothetical protein TVAGG3_0924440 [Trichomonas vaginalis G3]EAY10358.1 hypothetical protein TVAG_109420 [Trichomonas vaginalis G3]KAI5485359.1 hypothetical protein TVAGG3_0924440 [Trichomonas vaginalis G3]|eukprot:XP_001322581.1 hypothetical protein [Trichomonas vaginalis G3]
MSEEEDNHNQNKDEIDFWMNSDDDDVVNVSSDEDEKPKKPAYMITRNKSEPIEKSPLITDIEKSIDTDPTEVDQIIELDDESSNNASDNDYIVTRNGKKFSREQHASHAAVDYQYANNYPPKAIVEEDFVDPNKAKLNNAIDTTTQMIAHIMDLANDDEEPDTPAVNTVSDSTSDDVVIDPADPTRKLVHISSIESGNRWKVIWDQKDTFEQILYKISPELRNSIVTFSGIQWKINEVTFDIVSNGEEITLSEPAPEQHEPQNSNDRKLSFLLPDGTKKKLKVPLDKTWGYVLKSIGTGTKLLFDGEELNLRQKISSNQDIEDEDQIDVA